MPSPGRPSPRRTTAPAPSPNTYAPNAAGRRLRPLPESTSPLHTSRSTSAEVNALPMTAAVWMAPLRIIL